MAWACPCTTLAVPPLCDGEPGWQLLPDGAVVTLDATGCHMGHHAVAQPVLVS